MSTTHWNRGDSSVHVHRDNVLVKPWHVIVRSGKGTGHLMFWTRRAALHWADWLVQVLNNALEVQEIEHTEVRERLRGNLHAAHSRVTELLSQQTKPPHPYAES